MSNSVAIESAVLPTYADVESASERIRGQAHRTPVVTSRTVDEQTGCRVFFKCENLQRVGAFKFRGAYNALSRLSTEQQRTGVLAYSSGNHAQAVALAARVLGIGATIVMPNGSPLVKQAATRGYGAEIILYDPREASREELGGAIAAKRGLTIVPPFDHPHVIAGQGTAAKELIEEVGALDFLLVPCGGGGLLSGSALAASALSPRCKVIGIEPERADDATRSFRTGTLQRVEHPDTIADGARTPSLGKLTFPLVRRLAHDMATVSEEAIVAAMRVLWERLKLVVEPTGALGAAGLLSGRVDVPKASRIGILLSGGNVDLGQAAAWFA
jgi:threo-3-hydroxy-L-aspartate ammonia-lyase